MFRLLNNTVIVPVIAVATAMTSFGYSNVADACRDCGFPMRIAEGRWLMPNGDMELDVLEVKLPSRFSEMHVTLKDAHTGQTIAEGIVKQRKGKKNFNVRLQDLNGQLVQGFVRFGTDDQIEAHFACDSCSIGHMFN